MHQKVNGFILKSIHPGCHDAALDDVCGVIVQMLELRQHARYIEGRVLL